MTCLVDSEDNEWSSRYRTKSPLSKIKYTQNRARRSIDAMVKQTKTKNTKSTNITYFRLQYLKCIARLTERAFCHYPIGLYKESWKVVALSCVSFLRLKKITSLTISSDE